MAIYSLDLEIIQVDLNVYQWRWKVGFSLKQFNSGACNREAPFPGPLPYYGIIKRLPYW